MRLAGLLLLFAVLLAPGLPQAGPAIVVFAAASMKEAVESAALAYEERTGDAVVVSLASSSVLAKQIDAGAPADLYVSASSDWMDWLEQRGGILPVSRRDIAGNTLIVAASANLLANDSSLDALLSRRFAMGDPTHVPAGIYARQALAALGTWDAVEGNAVFGENVRVALEWVRRGEVDAAIVYGSDLNLVPELASVYVFAPSRHAPIVYPAALTAKGGERAQGFLDFLSSADGQDILAEAGLVPVVRPAGKAVE